MKAGQIEDFNSVQIIKERSTSTKQKGAGKKSLAILILLALILLALAGYYVFSVNRVGKTSYYLLVLDKAQTTLDAQEKSNSIKNAGGSGYIINEGEFLICGASYSSQSDAQSVLDRLISQYPNAKILQYNFEAIRIDSSLKQSLTYATKLIDFLLNQSEQLDLKNTSEGAVILLSNQKKSEVSGIVNSLNGNLNEQAVKICNFYNDILQSWQYLDSLDTSFGIYNHRIKYFSCLLIQKYHVLRNNLH